MEYPSSLRFDATSWCVVFRCPALRSLFHYSSAPKLHFSEIDSKPQAHARSAQFLFLTPKVCDWSPMKEIWH